MDWLSEKIHNLHNCACLISVFQGVYDNDPVFWELMNDPLCQQTINNVEIFNCKGEVLMVLESYENWQAFNQKLTDIRIIYTCQPPE